jgi:hypothetical protein
MLPNRTTHTTAIRQKTLKTLPRYFRARTKSQGVCLVVPLTPEEIQAWRRRAWSCMAECASGETEDLGPIG